MLLDKSKRKQILLRQTKKLYTAKEITSKTKRQLTKWEKIVVNDTPDKGLLSKM